MKKIVFFINSIQQQRCLKRIKEFLENGYEVDVYGFSRSASLPTLPVDFEIKVIGYFDNHMSYFRRMLLMYKAIKPIVHKYKRDNDVCFYYFLLDVAIIGFILSKTRYIYEESDLMQTYLKNNFLRFCLDLMDRKIIKNSLKTVMTSDGFALYHFKNNFPSNICFIPNRINESILNFPYRKHVVNIDRLRIAFVGGARFKSILNFVNVFLMNFPQHEFHFYGEPIDMKEDFYSLKSFKNVFFHGSFSNPKDLPSIYENIDLLLATYDVDYDNVLYAEPNKLYESIYFECPIIVSKGTYLETKVKSLGIGFSIDARDQNEIISFISSLSLGIIQEKELACARIPKIDAINMNDNFFKSISNA